MSPPMMDWLVRLWVAISPPWSAAPLRSVAVLLADDDRVWQPGGSEEHRQQRTILQLAGSRPCGASAANTPWTRSGTPSP